MQTVMIQFEDKLVSYDTFMNDLSSRIVAKIKSTRNDPEYVSQAQAYRMFGRANVERWRRQGKIHPRKRPGKLEYSVVELRKLQEVSQDYYQL